MTRPLRVGLVLHVTQVAGAEVLTREMVRRLRAITRLNLPSQCGQNTRLAAAVPSARGRRLG